MAQYSKVTDANGTTRYKDGSKFVKGDDVPENVKTALGENPDGTVVDELGDVVNPETDTDEGTGDDPDLTPPAPADDSADDSADEDGAGDDGEDDEEDDSEDESQTPPAAPTPAPRKRAARNQEVGGMGFPAKDGKTLSIFSDKPHETVKNVGGHLVPLTLEELQGDASKGVEPKTDAEIIEKLKELGKL